MLWLAPQASTHPDITPKLGSAEWRVATKSAAPEGGQGRVEQVVKGRQESCQVPALAEEWKPHRRPLQHMPAYASICQHMPAQRQHGGHRTLANTDTKSTFAVSKANFVQHKFQDPKDSHQDLQLGPKMAPKNPQNGPRDLQLGPSRLQDAPCDLHETSQITMRTAPPHDANDLHTFTPFQPQASDQDRNQSLQNGSRWPQLDPKMAQNSPKMTPTWPKMASK